jgi:hypothetical protein
MPKENWKAIIWGSLIFALIVGLILYGVTNRPLVDYKLDCPISISIGNNIIPSLNAVTLNFRNRGTIDTPINVILKSENITIEPSNSKPFVKYNNYSVTYTYTLSGGDKDTIYSIEQIYIKKQDKGADKFKLSLDVKKRFELSISGLFSEMFGEIKGFYPTSCSYNLTSKDIYSSTFELV